MKKCKLAFTVLTVVLLSLIMAVTASAANAPDRETANDIFYDMGFSTWGNGYFGCSVTSPEGDPAPDEVVFQYMYLSGTLNDYYNDETGYYTIAYDEYIALVDKTFVNHSDMKAYLADMIDPETNILSWFRGGFGGPETWIPTEYYVNGDYCYVTGVFADRDIEAYPDFVEKEYGKEIINDGDYQAVILHDIILTLKNTEDGWKILEYREAGYYVVEDYLYSFDEMFYRFTFENNGNVTLTEYEDTLDYFTGFYGNGSKWHPEISTHSWEIKATENYYIESVVLIDANGETVLTPDENNVYTFDVVGTGSLKVTTKGIPAIKEYNDGYAYFIGNDIVTDYSGLLRFEGVSYYIENGLVKTEHTGLIYYNDIWYYVENGIINWDYIGLVYQFDAWFYVNGGILDWSYTGLVYQFDTWFYVNGGILDWSYTGLVYQFDTWFYVNGGMLDWGYTGLVYQLDTWFYVNGGVLDWNYTGLCENYGMYFAINNGVLDWSYTGLSPYCGNYFYVNGGMLDWSYTGLCEYNGSYFYVNGGILDWSYTGLCEYYGTYFAINNGVLDWNYTGLSPYQGNYYYVNKGVLDATYTGLCEYYGNYFYVIDGVLDWNYTGLAYQKGTRFYISNGMLDYSYTGLAYYDGVWYYVSNGYYGNGYIGLCEYNGVWYYVYCGTVAWDYTGLCNYNGYYFFIKNGVVDFSFTGIWSGNSLMGYTTVYIKNGVVEAGFTGLYEYNGSTYLIENGYVVRESLIYEENGIVYYIYDGKVDFGFTGFVQVDYYWLYIENGIWDYTFTGKVDLEDGSIAYIQEGVVVDIR